METLSLKWGEKKEKEIKFSGGMTIRKISLKDKLMKKKEFYRVTIFQIPQMSQDVNQHHSHHLPWQILPDTVNHSRQGMWLPAISGEGLIWSQAFLYTCLLYICKSWGCTCSQLLLVCLQIQRAIARDRESFSAILFLSNSLCKMTRDFH